MAIWPCAFSPCAGLDGLPDDFWKDVTNVIYAPKVAGTNSWMEPCWLGCCFFIMGPLSINLGILYIYIYGTIAHSIWDI